MKLRIGKKSWESWNRKKE